MPRTPQQTRESILEAAFQEIHAHGFQGMRVDEIIRLSGFKKGAFYHHFKSKAELGYAVMEDKITPFLENLWIKPLSVMRNPIAELPTQLKDTFEQLPAKMAKYGCPLNNIAQEMSALDEFFRQLVNDLFNRWIDTLKDVFEQGKHDGYVRQNVDSHAVACFVVASIEGSISLYKTEHDHQLWPDFLEQLSLYLQMLKA